MPRPLCGMKARPPTMTQKWPVVSRTRRALKARRRQLGISDGVLDRLVAQITLDGARIDTIVCQFVAAAMPQHVRVDFHVKARRASGTFYHGLEAAF